MDPNLEQLLIAWMSAEPDDAEALRLLELLRQDKNLRSQFVQEIVLLGQLRAVQSSEPRWLEVEDMLGTSFPGELTSDEFESSVMDSLSAPSCPVISQSDSQLPYSADNATNLQWYYLAFATMLTIIMCWCFAPSTEHEQSNLEKMPEVAQAPSSTPSNDVPQLASPNYVAVLSKSIDAKWSGAHHPAIGTTLTVGDLKLDSGTVQLEFFSGVRLLLRGPADIELRAVDEVRLRQGEASCFVTEVGRGFRILTSEMEVVDLGTAFSISVHEGKRPEVHVLEGAVEIRADGSPAIEVKGHHAVRLDKNGLTGVAFTPDRFPQPAELESQRQDRVKLRFEAWQQRAEELRSDPDLLLHYTFQEEPTRSFELRNSAIGTVQATDGVVIGCDWTEGRWPAKRALLYRSEGDRVLFQVPGQFEQLTFLIWLRIDALTQTQTSILMTEEPYRRKNLNPTAKLAVDEVRLRRKSSQVKSVRWEIFEPASRVSFSVAYSNAEDGWEYTSCHSKTQFPTQSDWGTWNCIAVTCDAAHQQIIQYLNGREIGRRRLPNRLPILLDYMTLGNFSVSQAELERSNGLAQRRFFGAIDELQISQRIYSAEEIAKSWRDGQP